MWKIKMSMSNNLHHRQLQTNFHKWTMGSKIARKENPWNYEQTDSKYEQNSNIHIQYFDAICVNKEVFRPRQFKDLKIKCPQNLKIEQITFIEPNKSKFGICIDCFIHEITENRSTEIFAKNTTNRKDTLNKKSKIGQVRTEFITKTKLNKSEGNNLICNNITVDEIRQLRR